MGDVYPLPTAEAPTRARSERSQAVVYSMEDLGCALCGFPISAGSLRYRVVSPYSAAAVTVCHTCRTVAQGEGYRPGA